MASHTNADTLTVEQNTLDIASLFVADGAKPIASGSVLILLGGKKQINEQVMRPRTNLFDSFQKDARTTEGEKKGLF